MSLADSTTATSSPVAAVAAAAVAASGPPLKWLWVAVGVLGMSVVALGTTLVVQNTGKSSTDPVATGLRAPQSLEMGAPQTLAAASPQGLMAQSGAMPAAWSPQTSQQQPYPQQQQQAAMRPVAGPPRCNTCGRVESVQPVQQAAPATGVGAVAGGVLGAVVGNQVGKGHGRTAATVLGAVGGGYVGHKVEERTRTQTVYQMTVRMDDGSVRRFTRSQPTAVGTPIVLQGKGFRVDDRMAPRAEAPYPSPQAGMVRVADTY